MAELLIRDETIARRVLDIAEREGRSVEAVIASMIDRYQSPPPLSDAERAARLRAVRARAYAEARRYWQEAGDTARLALTDEELDAQFWMFDAEGIPRLKADEGQPGIVPSSRARLAASAKAANIQFSSNDVASRSREILEEEFADYLLRRMRGDYSDLE
jgi:hypothetical protein